MYLSNSASIKTPNIYISQLTPNTDTGWTTSIMLNPQHYIFMTDGEANTLALRLIQHLYDTGTMTRAAAETIGHLTSVVLMDAAEYAEIVAMSNGEDF